MKISKSGLQCSDLPPVPKTVQINLNLFKKCQQSISGLTFLGATLYETDIFCYYGSQVGIVNTASSFNTRGQSRSHSCK